jgi:hypothetical protein
MKAIAIKTDAGKVVGHVIGDIFYKKVSGTKHFLRSPPGIAFDVSSIEAATKAGALFLNVMDGDTGCIYAASLATLGMKGIRLNRGHGAQIALPMAHWSIDNPRQLKLL